MTPVQKLSSDPQKLILTKHFQIVKLNVYIRQMAMLMNLSITSYSAADDKQAAACR